MTGSELATLSTLAWVVLTLTLLVLFGTWSTGASWSILPGLVRGVHDWAAEHAIARQPASPSPWAVTMPDPAIERSADGEPFECSDGVEIEELRTIRLSH